MSPIVAIVGRPNVGKSTLFNRLSRSRDALVDDQPGITRDRLYATVRVGDSLLTLIDTGGFEESTEQLLGKVREQVVAAMDEADAVIFMVDGPQGIMPGDKEIADLLRRSQKKVFLAVNKIDGPEHDALTSEFYSLGLERVYPISSAHGWGIKGLMADLVEELPEAGEQGKDQGDQIRVAIVGKPNVGKSSLVNRLLGFERVLVSELPGTTRDSVDTVFHYHGRDYLLIDTAGIRRKARVKEKIEKISMIKALRSLERCHIAVVLLDGATGISEQDARICGYAFERSRGIILAVNKWDLVKKDPERKKGLENEIDRQLNFASFAPRIRLSALTGEHVSNLFVKIDLVYEKFSHRVGTGELNRVMEEIVRMHPPPQTGARRLKILFATQTGTRPPTFVVFVNRPEAIHLSYRRFIMNQIRERCGLRQIPVRVFFRKRESRGR